LNENKLEQLVQKMILNQEMSKKNFFFDWSSLKGQIPTKVHKKTGENQAVALILTC